MEQDSQPNQAAQDMEIEPENNATPSAENTEEPPAEEGQSISGMVNQSLVQTLKEMGFSTTVCEKSLFLTGNNSVESAFEWINEHQNDPDFEEELRIVGQAQNKQKLSKEEAQRKARELQEELKRKRIQKEKEEELQREKDRIRSTRELAEAKRKFEEQESKRATELYLREKKKTEDELKKMHELLKKDKEARTGKKATEDAASAKPPQEKMASAIKTVKTLYPNFRNPGVAAQTLNTLKAYITNIVSNPEEEKFQRIRIENKAFQDRIAKVSGAIVFLKAAGFEEENGFYVLKNRNLELLQEGIRMLDDAIVTI
ncbi:unnamed protein product [Blepharisma stoltei]|uniref:UBA domain-containing protein n=1 Tax=Blepharisma stoltei TaxID=1481888 RepID=A0AAU9IRU7_9CILI|nr:unnamed protein product [Blepharisma stoltei]